MAKPLHNSGDIPQNAAHICTRLHAYTHCLENLAIHYALINTHY